MKALQFLKKLFSKKEKVKIYPGMQITKAAEIRAIIEPIPEDLFIVEIFGNQNGKSCFLGHINRAINPAGDKNNCWADRHGFGARQLTEKFLHKYNADGTTVNNSPTVNGYTEPKIKDRIMHLIDDMEKAGY